MQNTADRDRDIRFVGVPRIYFWEILDFMDGDCGGEI